MTGSESKITRFKNAQFSRFILNSPLFKLVMKDIVRRNDNECKTAGNVRREWTLYFRDQCCSFPERIAALHQCLNSIFPPD